jgi:hypothetical protein
MRYIKIPEPEMLRGATIVNPTTKEPEPARYSLEALNTEFVWPATEWRTEAGVPALARCFDAFDGRKPGDWAVLLDEDYEQYKRVALLAGTRPPLPPFLARFAITMLLAPVLAAPSKLPTGEAEAPQAPSAGEAEA